eukprot:4493241-Amphidinium_carterae.2
MALLTIVRKAPKIMKRVIAYAKLVAREDGLELGSDEDPADEDGDAKTALVKKKGLDFAERYENLLSEELPSFVHNIHRLPHESLQVLMWNLQESLTPFAWTAHRARGSRTVSKDILCEVLEFMTGLPRETPANSTIWPTLGSMCKDIVQKWKQQGQRSVVLPVDWSTQGLYIVGSITMETVEIKHRFSEETVCVRNTDALGWTHIADIHITKNYSMIQAALAVRGTARSRSMRDFFESDGSAKMGNHEGSNIQGGRALCDGTSGGQADERVKRARLANRVVKPAEMVTPVKAGKVVTDVVKDDKQSAEKTAEEVHAPSAGKSSTGSEPIDLDQDAPESPTLTEIAEEDFQFLG